MPVLLVALALQTTGSTVEPAPAAALGDLRLDVKLNRPLLVDVKRVIDLRYDVTVLTVTTTVPRRTVDEWRFVDVHSACKAGEENFARQFLQTFTTQDGRVEDPELTGIRVDLALSDGKWSLRTADERVAALDRLGRIVDQASAASMWIPLPKDAPLDAEFDVDMQALLRTLLDQGRQLTSTPARMRIESLGVDPPQARLGGRVACTFEQQLRGGAMEIACELAVTLEIDRAERRLRRVRLDGKATAKSKGLMDVAGGGRVTVETKTMTGEPATTAQREKPRFRMVERRLAREGISFIAPSSWFNMGRTEPWHLYGWSFGDENGFARILIARSRDKFDAATIIATNRALYPDGKIEMSSNPIGSVVRYEVEAEGSMILGDACAFDANTTLTFKLVTPPSLLAAARVDFEAIRKSLKKLAPE